MRNSLIITSLCVVVLISCCLTIHGYANNEITEGVTECPNDMIASRATNTDTPVTCGYEYCGEVNYNNPELVDEDTSKIIFDSKASFPISWSSLTPSHYVVASSTYYIIGGSDKLDYSTNWAPTGQNIQIGFVNVNDTSLQYWSASYSGGSKSGTLNTNGVPNGEYYVAILASGTNTVNISVNGTFEWQ